MSDSTVGAVALAALLALGFTLVGMVAGRTITTNQMQTQAVEHGCAAYDPKTGEWGWIEN